MTQKNRTGICIVTALFLLAASPVPANGSQAYFNDFDGGLTVAPKVTGTFGGVIDTESVQGYDGIGSPSNMFGGEFLRNTTGGGEPPPREPGTPTTLTLTGLPPHKSIDINFLLAIIDSWDGTEPGEGPEACTNCHPDIFTVTVDGNPIFSEAFGFNGPIFMPSPEVLLVESAPLGFGPNDDDAAFDMGLYPAFHNIPHSAKSLTIEWVASGDGWQGGDDESWAIDNVEVVLFKTVAPEKVCVVNEVGGSDSPFNQSVAEGVKQASHKLHVEVATLDAETDSELEENFETFVTDGDCDLIIGVGFTVGPAMDPFAWDYPDQQFVIIDSGFGGAHDNVAEVMFHVDQAAFLAGYAAAGTSKTGKVGVFGGLPIPPITLFMDGFALGVEWFNTENGASVEVLGWDPDLQTGLFTFDFGNPAAGEAIASDLYDLGADTVFAVAGLTGYGALDEAVLRKADGESVRVIGVDFDWSEEFGDADRVILTSVVKNSGVLAFNQIEALVEGTWASGTFFEGLDTGAMEMAPFHKLNNQVPGSIKRDLKDIREGIIDGSIPTTPPPP
jgi:basic membrane protein A